MRIKLTKEIYKKNQSFKWQDLPSLDKIDLSRVKNASVNFNYMDTDKLKRCNFVCSLITADTAGQSEHI